MVTGSSRSSTSSCAGAAICAEAAHPRALVWATDFDKLPADRVIVRREGYLVVRSPGHPQHHWGNLLLFDAPPVAGDRARWERSFDAEFGDQPGVQHRTFAWDRIDGEIGMAREEFVAAGYEMEDTIGPVAAPGEIRAHPRENREVRVRTLDPVPGGDPELWQQVIELRVLSRDEASSEPEDLFRSFSAALYESLGFRRGEHVHGVCQTPAARRASAGST